MLFAFKFTECRNLQEALIDEYKRIGFEIPLSPIYDGLNDDFKVNIDELYTDLVIEVRDKKEGVPLKSYKDIFRMKGRTNRTIFLKGEAGVGKTTWCNRLLHAWVKTHDKNRGKSGDDDSPTSEALSDNVKDLEEAISQFDYLFLVPLRHVKGKTSIKDVIFSTLLERLANMKDIVDTVFKHHSIKILILLDGIDEYKHDLSYEGLNQCTVITTTRPWKYDQVCASNPGRKVDMVLNLKGLDDIGISKLIEKVYIAFQRHASSDMPTSQGEGMKDIVSAFERDVESCGLNGALTVPLTLIILLETYLENSSLSPSMTGNLVRLLEVLIRRGKQKIPQSDLERAVRNSKEKHSLGSTAALFAENETLSDYASLLQKLSKLAFGGILNSKKEETLLFSKKQLCQVFSEDEQNVCLQFGLLSQSRVFASLLKEPKTSLSFYHKLIQEFFAAAWIVYSSEARDEFRNSITSRSAILEFENVFIFICGIDAHIGSELSKHFVDVCKNYKIRRTEIPVAFHENEYEAFDVFSLMLRAQKEAEISAKSHDPIYVLDVNPLYFDMIDGSNLLKLLQASTAYLRCLRLYPLQVFKLHSDIRILIEIIENSTELQEIWLDSSLIGRISGSHFQDEDLRNMALDFSRHIKLKYLHVSLDFSESCQSLFGSLLSALGSLPNLKHLNINGLYWRSKIGGIILEVIPNLKALTTLSLSNRRRSILGGDRDQISSSIIAGDDRDLIVSSKELRHLDLHDMDLGSDGIVLNSCKLESVKVTNVKMAAFGWSGLCEILSKQDSLINVELINESDIVKREERLDLSKSRQLETLSISSLELPALNVYEGTDLKRLSLENVKMAEPAWCRLFSALRFKNLKSIKLKQLDLGSAEIDLSQATQLERLSIDNVKLRVADSAEQTKSDGTIIETTSNIAWERLFNSLPTNNLRILCLSNLDIGHAEIDLSQVTQLEMFTIDNVKLCVEDSAGQRKPDGTSMETTSNIAWERLFNSLPTNNLKELCLSNLDIGRAEIDLSRATQLDMFTIDNVKLRVADSAEQTKPDGTSMETTSNIAWERLFNSLPTNNLKKLSLSNLDIGRAEIDLSQVTQLDMFTIDNVKLCVEDSAGQRKPDGTSMETTSNIAWERLFNSLPTNNLRILCLSNLDIGHAEIDLSQVTQLEMFTIDNVKLCVEDSAGQRKPDGTSMETTSNIAWERLFNSLPTNNLKELCLSNLDIGHAEIDLSQATQLEGLTIDNVKLCVEDSAGQSKSDGTNMETTRSTAWERTLNCLPTKTLERLKLSNVDIGTAIIPIDKNSRLWYIILGNVKMSKNAFDTLHSSLKSLSKLSIVTIKNTHVEGDIINMTLEDIRK